MKRQLALAAALTLAVAQGAWAQISTGNIYGTVLDESGAALPGASIAITGATIGARSTTSGPQGDFRFLGVDHGNYKLTVTLTGFSTVTREVIVTTGVNVNLSFAMKVASVEETITVNAETPVVDIKKQGTGVTFTREELTEIPSGRDPWVVLRSVPGVIVDRVNIAGNESGQQANFIGKGSIGADTMWNLDGVAITDMSATGSSSYFDFDAFDEINVNTGGADLKVQTGGIGLNFVTKRGTNSFHGSARGYFTHNDLESGNLPSELQSDARLKNSDGTFRDKADNIAQIADLGADLGGPIVKDKLWFWASYGKQDIRVQRLSGTPDRTVLKDYNAKVNWQASSNDMVSGFWFLGAKEKYGRSPGSGLQETNSYLWNQAGAFPDKFHGLFKLEDNHVFSPNFVVDAKLSYWGTGFGFTPIGGTGCNAVFDNVKGIASGCSSAYKTLRPQKTASVDGSYFANGMGGSHEFKFGFGFKQDKVTSTTRDSGDQIEININNGGPLNAANADAPNTVGIWRDGVTGQTAKYWSVYAGDTFTKDRLTVNVGVRFDKQTSVNAASTAPAALYAPELLPAVSFGGGGTGVDWTDVSPRLGFTYALDAGRKTVLRGSFARYAGQLPSGQASQDSPVGAQSYLEYVWVDTNNDGTPQRAELGALNTFGNINPSNPTAIASSNKIDPNYKANHDTEVIAGVDHELAANFAVGVAYTYRKGTDYTWPTPVAVNYPTIGITSNDFHPGLSGSQNGYSAQVFTLNSGVLAGVSGGTILENRPGYARNFNGVEVTANKRLADKWMARAGFSYNDWTESIGAGSFINPTKQATVPLIDGGQVINLGSGSGKSVYYSAKWAFNASALYQLPAGFEVSGNLYGRQGFPRPIYLRLNAGAPYGSLNALAVPQIDSIRLPNLWNLDLRLAKNLKIAGSTAFTLTADAFNVLNKNTVLNRFNQANSSSFNRLDEILNPRIVRLGLRLSF